MELILASTSPYRRALLERLQIPFSCVPPEVDETPINGERPDALAMRLSVAKAHAVARLHPGALVIGSDQVASLNAAALGKPGTLERARAQLAACSGKRVTFFTGLAVINADRGLALQTMAPFDVHFRELAPTEIDRYLEREQPFDCAGSFKVEGLGITLFERLQGDDPTALEGLPLIALSAMLRDAEYDIY